MTVTTRHPTIRISIQSCSKVHGPGRVEGGLDGGFWAYRTGVMRDPGFDFPRITLPRTPVNKGKKKGRYRREFGPRGYYELKKASC
jgi:hypothetical protein